MSPLVHVAHLYVRSLAVIPAVTPREDDEPPEAYAAFHPLRVEDADIAVGNLHTHAVQTVDLEEDEPQDVLRKLPQEPQEIDNLFHNTSIYLRQTIFIF